jgi:hypothetical protein
LSWNQYARGDWATLSAAEKRQNNLSSEADWIRASKRDEIDAVASGHGHDFKQLLKSPDWVSHKAGDALVWTASRRVTSLARPTMAHEDGGS